VARRADFTRESVESGRRESNSHYQLGMRMGGCVDRDSHKDWVSSEHWPMTVIDPHSSHADRTTRRVVDFQVDFSRRASD
jgi:hypothetical protein